MDLLSSSRSSSTKKISKNIDENNINNINLNKYYSETGPDTGLGGGGGGGTKGMESYEHAGSEHSYQSQVKFNFIYFV